MNNVGFGYEDPLDYASPSPQIEVTPSQVFNQSDNVIIAGGYFEFNYNPALISTQPEYKPQATTLASDKNVQFTSVHEVIDENNTLLKVMLLKPEGFLPANVFHAGIPGVNKNLIFNIFWLKTYTLVDDTNWQDAIQLISGEYVDINGDVIPGVTPVLTKVR